MTALAPVADAGTWDRKPQITPLDAAAPERGVVIIYPDQPAARTEVLFADGETASAEAITLTGRAGVVQRSGKTITRLLLSAGTRLTVDKQPWLQVTGKTPATLEADYSQPKRLALSGDNQPVRCYAPGVTAVTFNGKAVPFRRQGNYIAVTPPPLPDSRRR